jgi:hypothetical protein
MYINIGKMLCLIVINQLGYIMESRIQTACLSASLTSVFRFRFVFVLFYFVLLLVLFCFILFLFCFCFLFYFVLFLLLFLFVFVFLFYFIFVLFCYSTIKCVLKCYKDIVYGEGERRVQVLGGKT